MTLTATHLPVSGSTEPTVVLLHGFTANAEEDFIANGFAKALNDAGRSVLAVNLPGHGGNAAIADPAEVSTSKVVAAILDTVSEYLADGEFDVVGYSLGARLAWELPGKSDRVRKVVLGGISPMEPFGAVDPAELDKVLGGAEPSNPLVGMMAGMISAPGRDTASLAKLIPGLASEPFTPANGGPQVPTLLVAGTEDQMTQGIDGLAAALPNATLVQVPGDHRGALDSAEFKTETVKFLN